MSDTDTTTTVWDRIVGQERAVTLLRRAAERPVHAYLLAGPPGSGIEDAARCFAAALVAPDGDPGAVDRVLRGVHPDVVEVEPESTVISVDQARDEIVPEASRSPIEGGRKVIVVLEAERLQPEAANALLKTFEEPARTTCFVIVTSSPDELLDTVRSRCQRINFAPLDEQTIRRALEEAGCDADTAVLAARLSGGQLGRARDLVGERRGLRDAFVLAAARLDGTGSAVSAVVADLSAAIQTDLAELHAAHERELEAFDDEVEARGYTPRDVSRLRRRMVKRHDRHERRSRRDALVEGITALESVYRDVLASDGPHRNLDREAPHVAPAAAAAALDACRQAREAFEFNPNESLLLERLLLHLPPSIGPSAR